MMMMMMMVVVTMILEQNSLNANIPKNQQV